MGRPRRFDRDAALDQALQLFWEQGYDATSIADLTRALGISAPSLYAAFGDKRALFDEAVARYEASPRSVTTAGTAGRTPREVLGAMLDVAVREYVDEDHPRGCLVNSSPELADRRAANRAATAAHVAQVTGVAADPDPGRDPATLAAFAHALLIGLSSSARDGADGAQLARIAELALRAVPE
ncbi:TetR/AcrR family transcriptional regulator [Kineococcus sp. NPDC059986]|uniref:TetR/AcrR family transcriptional regulator n=1 Tax=Kineococcus sp. NPDC059986 TaxID=3155538 RepID=UPI00344ED0CD